MAENTNTKLGIPEVKSSDSAIQAYLDAKTAQRKIRDNWDIISDVSSQALAGAQRQREAVQLDEDRKRKELEFYEDQFSNNVALITENAGSLGEEYFGLATQEAKKMQEEYAAAVKNEDKEAQGKLKIKLQGLSTSVQSLKENLTIAAELKNDEMLSGGRTERERLISAVCTDPNNIVYADGEWKWKNPKYDPNVEGSQEFFTQDDLSKSLVQIDQVTSQAYLNYEATMNQSGMMYINGDPNGTAFERERIKTSIGDNFITKDNIMSVMHDDFRGTGNSTTFKANLSGYLDDIASKQPNFYRGLGIDVDGPNGVPDGIVDEYDFDMVGEDKKRIMDAITNKDSKYGYDYELSKNIVADYLTMFAEKKFYGEHSSGLSILQRKALRPREGEDQQSFINRGGILGELTRVGIVWDPTLNKFIESSDKTSQELADELDNL
tara:strand:+ start:861 stop:2171 length:1311 start_codon:yes stop_codon:yes gene_type:complete